MISSRCSHGRAPRGTRFGCGRSRGAGPAAGGVSGIGGVVPAECVRGEARGRHNSLPMQKIRAAVIGVGYLGRFHAQKYAQAEGCELIAVVDSRPQARETLAAELKTRAVGDYRE